MLAGIITIKPGDCLHVAECICGLQEGLYHCETHHSIWRGTTQLPAVTRIIKACWPQEPCRECEWPMYSKHRPSCSVKERIQNACERGIEVNALFDRYVLGYLDVIPIHTRLDSQDLFWKLVDWFDAQHFRRVEVQVVLGNADYGGVLDYRFDGIPYELKCTYDVEQTHIMQAAAYEDLSESRESAVILHCTERYREPRVRRIRREDKNDWLQTLEYWRMLQRRCAIKQKETTSCNGNL